MFARHLMTVGLACAAASAATASYTITQGSTPTTYSGYTLNFDEPGTPTGVVADTTWQMSHGVTIGAGDGVPVVDDNDALQGGWGLGDGNSFFGNFGVFINFDYDVTEMAFEMWDTSGTPSPFGGGAAIFLYDDGNQVDSLFNITPAFGGIGDSWFNVVADSGMVFDEIRILGFGTPAFTFVDNLSWNAVPTPGAIGLFGIAGMAAIRRRR